LEDAMPRAPRPDDLYRLRIATEPRLSPDGRLAVVTLQTVAPGFDGYRHALWLVATDGDVAPRQLTLGAKHDRYPRFSPDGRTLAFLSDRRPIVEEEPGRAGAEGSGREDGDQVHLLPLDGGEARRLTDLPRGVDAFEWSPDGRRIVAVSAARGATRAEDQRRRGLDRSAEPATPPSSDYRFIDRLEYMLNGKGFTYDRVTHLWLVDASSGAATRLTDGRVSDSEPAWSPDGRRIAFTANRRRDADLVRGRDLHVVDVESRVVSPITHGPRSMFFQPAWLPDGRTIAALGHRYQGRGGSRNDIWLFAADGSDATPAGGRNLSARHDLMPGSGMASDVTRSENAALTASRGGRWLYFSAPTAGAYELWRIAVGDGRVERLTEDRHYISSFHAAA
jgi:dipeptidyl aminopeptidase/acylaminoacyl peptidase